MTLAELERELRAHGFESVRQNGSHRTYRHHPSGRTLTVKVHHGGQRGGTYSRAEIVDIRRSLAHTLALAAAAGTERAV